MKTTVATTVALVLRGLRSRGLLSAASLVMMVLAVGGTVVGPAFQDAVTTSYTLTRLSDANDALTGLTFEATAGPDQSLRDLADQATAQVAAAVPDAYLEPDLTLDVGPFIRPRDGVEIRYQYRENMCELLVLRGRCVQGPGEVLLNTDDLDRLDVGLEIGGTVTLPRLGAQTVVGTYRTPEDSSVWLLPGRLTSRTASPTTPYRPAPVFVTEDVLAELPRISWRVVLDSRLQVPERINEAELDDLVTRVDQLSSTNTTLPGGGALVSDLEVNALPAVVADIASQRDAARATMTPAVVSLALLAIAIILRLLAAAADLRTPELALAALRGVSARRTWLLALAEPLLLLALAAPIGLLAGYGATHALADIWLRPGTTVTLPTGSWVGATVVVAAIAAVAALVIAQGLRETLASRVAGVRRPPTTQQPGSRAGTGGVSRLGLVIEVLLVVSAIVLLLARLGTDTGAGNGLGLSDLLLPVVVAVAAGLVVTRATSAAAGFFTRRGAERPLSVFIAARALARRAQGTLVVLPVAAAIAVAVFATGIDAVADNWRASVAATRAPADRVYTSPLAPGITLRLTRQVDPEGQWVMSAAQLSAPEAAPIVMVDSSRLDRVAQWSDQWLPNAGAAEAAGLVAPATPLIRLTGRRASLTGQATSPVTVVLVVDTGGTSLGFLRLGPFPVGTTTQTTTNALCENTCEVRQIRLEGDGDIRLSSLTIDDIAANPELTSARWMTRTDPTSTGTTADPSGTSSAAPVEDSSLLVASDADLFPAVAVVPIPALVGVDAETGNGVLDLVGTPVTITSTDRAESLPLVGPAGILVDQTTLLTRVDPDPALVASYVLVRADAPADVTNALTAAGLTAAPGYSETRDALDDSAYAQALRLYLVVAATLLLMALGGLIVSSAVQLPARRRDAAALRVVGVPRRTVALAALAESLTVLGVAALTGLTAGTLSQAVLLPSLTLGLIDDPFTPRVLPETDTGRLLILTATVLAVLVLVSALTSSAVVRGARGATLRENAR